MSRSVLRGFGLSLLAALSSCQQSTGDVSTACPSGASSCQTQSTASAPMNTGGASTQANSPSSPAAPGLQTSGGSTSQATGGSGPGGAMTTGEQGQAGGAPSGASPTTSTSPSTEPASSGGAGGSSNAEPDPGTPDLDSGVQTMPPEPSADTSAEPDTSAGMMANADQELCDVGNWDGNPPQALQLSGNTFAHDPTMIESDGTYYRFWTGDNIPTATSQDLRNWSNAPAVYQNGYSDWTSTWLMQNPGNTFNFPWAPDASKFNGLTHIYSAFSAVFGKNISCITHLTTDNVAGNQWTDHGPVICTDGSQPYNAIDADVGFETDGTPWLAFGSFWDGIFAFQLDQDGNRVGDELTRLAWAKEIEAPVLFYRCGYYYLFVSWGLCCPGNGRSVSQLTYRVAVGRAEAITGPYVDRDGVSMLDGGGTIVVEGDHVNYAAAGHSDIIVTNDTIYHFYHAYRQSDGGAELRIVELPFDEEGWPVGGPP